MVRKPSRMCLERLFGGFILTGLLGAAATVYLADHNGTALRPVFERVANIIFPNSPVDEIETIDIQNVEIIDIKSVRAKIEFLGDKAMTGPNRAELVLRGVIPDNDWYARSRIDRHYSIHRSGRQLEVRAVDDFTREKGHLGLFVFEPWARKSELTVTLKVSKSFQGRLRIMSASGSVKVEGVHLKRLEVRTVSGKIEVDGSQSEETDIKSAMDSNSTIGDANL
jgi:hypothetical protein